VAAGTNVPTPLLLVYRERLGLSPAVLTALLVSAGLALSAGLSLTARLARPERRGALAAVCYACAYVGFAAPYVTAVTAAATRVKVPLLVAAALAVTLAVRPLGATRDGQLDVR